MKVIWSEFASASLKDIYVYHRKAAGINIVKKIKDNIFSTTRQLISHPNSGSIEQTLLRLNLGHRCLVAGNYKIIYKIVLECILITDIFDNRKDSPKINNPQR